MRRFLVPVFCIATASLQAELLRVVMRFQPTACASCTQSLPERFQRIRGVKSAVLDVEKQTVTIELEPSNRVRLSRLRDALQQDGTGLLGTTVDANGECREDDKGVWLFQPQPGDGPYPIRPREAPAAGSCSLAGVPVD